MTSVGVNSRHNGTLIVVIVVTNDAINTTMEVHYNQVIRIKFYDSKSPILPAVNTETTGVQTKQGLAYI